MAVGVNNPPENAMVSSTSVEDHEASSEQNQTAIPQPKPFVAESELFAPVPAVGHEPSCAQPEREKTLDQLIHENLMLQAKQRNRWLKSQM